ncbi:MFS transporter [Acidisoma cellulosilytica]|uniref:MFS transporter n=1 Tax=Acidisoma cellulosilyticum TaxID=2802395 RepID=A0A963Z3X5_9PROT|nr:MFS transporter [Acidisoma cellulosilyticum]MCB8882430.1 MFS transporter [Acidisoma cellulosilyticum]
MISASTHLALINFFTGDIQGGLGPFLATWLAWQGGWSPARVGSVMTVIGLFALLLNGPAGAIVDHTRYPRLVLATACGAILLGTAIIVHWHGLVWVIVSQCLAGAGGTLMLPALTLFTLGIVGKDRFPKQQGRNQAFNHAGIVVAALLIIGLSSLVGPTAPFWVFGTMALGAIIAIFATPAQAFNGRRAHGWEEGEPDHVEHRSAIGDILRNAGLARLALALTLFNLANGYMLALISQRLVVAGHNGTGWLAAYVVIAQGVMIPVALWAGHLADQKGRRRLLTIACLALPLRAILSAFTTDPWVLIVAEVLDGVSSGLIGVAIPVVVADLTWGTGRTQTALGALNTIQGVGGALSGLFGGTMVSWLGWQNAFFALAIPAAVAAVLVFGIPESHRDIAGGVREAVQPGD